MRRHREDRDGDGAAVPGAVRRGDGDSPRHRRRPTTSAHSSPCPTRAERPARQRTSKETTMTDQRTRPAIGRAGRPPGDAGGGGHPCRRVPDPDDEASRDRQRGRVSRSSSTTPRRSSPRSASRCAATRPPSTRFADAGCDVDGERVRFPRGLARSLVATAPASYVQHARNPAHNVTIGGDATVFAPNYGSPFVHDLDNGRRYATLADFQNFVKLTYLVTAPPPLRRHGVRTGRHPRQQAPPRHGVQPPALQRQADHGLGHGRRAGRRLASSWPASRSAATSPTAP